MIGKYSLAAAVVLGALGSADVASATTMKGHCSITASVHGGKKFAALKCDKEDRPGDFVIRSTVWEKDDPKAYGQMVRFAGRQFTCELSRGSTTRGVGVETTHYHMGKCR
jgi:hypothetical protein